MLKVLGTQNYEKRTIRDDVARRIDYRIHETGRLELVVVEHSALVAAVVFHFRFDSGMGDIEFTCLILYGGDYLIEFRDIGDHGMYGEGVFGR